MTPARPASGPLAGEPGPVMRWVAGARPRTLPAAVVPVVVGTAAARPWTGAWSGCPSGLYWRALAALVVALAIQVGTNYANDYSDGIRGTDEVRVGPLRLVASGLASPSSVRRAALAAFALAAAVGLVLAAVTSWWVLLVGAACLAAGWFYTGGPKPYGYVGLGEVFVFVFFGLVATVGTFYVESLKIAVPGVVVAGAGIGLLATALLLANNLRDIATDREAGKKTLASRIGRKAGGWCYVASVVLPFLGVAVWAIGSLTGQWTSHWPLVAVLPLAAAVLAVAPVRLVLSPAEGRALLPVLAATGRLQMAFGALLAVAVFLWIPAVR